jgi:hypothetical protein
VNRGYWDVDWPNEFSAGERLSPKISGGTLIIFVCNIFHHKYKCASKLVNCS